MTAYIDASTLAQWLADGQEIALLDVREHGQYGEGHPFLACNLPYSRLELDAPRLLPSLGVRTVLFDDGDGVATRAARRLAGLGYPALHVLEGGAAAWAAAGHTLFQGVNVPSKTFGELLEHARHTPRIGPEELHRRQAAGEALLLLDGRTPQEHRKMTIPGAIPLPNGELALRAATLLRDTTTPVVVHCAGRTRSIVGAETLRALGVPNPVFALENGTQGWRLAGLDLEHGSPRLPPVAATPIFHEGARAFADKHGAPVLSADEAQRWLDDPGRSTYLFDVRSGEEFAERRLSGAHHVPGGQLVQATDLYIAVRHARVLLVDDDGLRAAVAAGWLRQLGFEAATVDGGIDAPLRVPTPAGATPPAVAELDATALRAAADRADTVWLDLRGSRDHRRSRPLGARWATRPRVARGLPAGAPVVLVASDGDEAALAAIDLAEAGHGDVRWTRWTTWLAASLPVDPGDPDTPADAEAIDYLLFVHDRHDGNLAAARRYLDWETGLIGQCSPQELAVFRLEA